MFLFKHYKNGFHLWVECTTYAGAQMVVEPLETLKILKQNDVPYDLDKVYDSKDAAFFYRGFFATILKYFPIKVLDGLIDSPRLSSDLIHKIKPVLRLDDLSTNFLYAVIRPLPAELAQFVFTVPLDFLKNRLVREESKSLKEDYKQIVASPQSIFAFYSGWAPALLSLLLYRIFYVLAEFNLRRFLFKSGSYQTTLHFLSQLVACGVSYPFDVIRAKLEKQALLPPRQRPHKSPLHCLSNTLKGGLSSLYIGFGFHFLSTFLCYTTLALIKYGFGD